MCFISFLACGSQLPRKFVGKTGRQVKDFLVLFVFSSMPADQDHDFGEFAEGRKGKGEMNY